MSDSDSEHSQPPPEPEFPRMPSLSDASADIARMPAIHEIVQKHSNKIFIGALAFGAAFVLLGVGASLVVTMVGVVYPAFMSYKAVKTQDKSDDTEWLIYWIVFAIFRLFDTWTSFITDLIPFYHLFEVGFLVFLMAPPDVRGAKFIYRNFIEVAFDAHHDRIENSLQTAKGVASEVVDQSIDKFATTVSAQISDKTGITLAPDMVEGTIRKSLDPTKLLPPLEESIQRGADDSTLRNRGTGSDTELSSDGERQEGETSDFGGVSMADFSAQLSDNESNAPSRRSSRPSSRRGSVNGSRRASLSFSPYFENPKEE